MSKETKSYCDTTYGVVEICCNGSEVTAVKFCKEPEGVTLQTNCALAQQVCEQLEEYYAGTRQEFDLPVRAKGTDFQHKVWQELSRIPYGQTRSYGQVAAAIGSPKAARAVGMANNRNPLTIIVPCHRVVGANGALVGYGAGLERKVAFLELEAKGAGAAKK